MSKGILRRERNPLEDVPPGHFTHEVKRRRGSSGRAHAVCTGRFGAGDTWRPVQARGQRRIKARCGDSIKISRSSRSMLTALGSSKRRHNHSVSRKKTPTSAKKTV